jgi:hypothetical protein
MQARGSGLHEVEWGVNMSGLGGQNAAAHALGEERVVILDGKERWLWGRRRGAGGRLGGLHWCF